MSKTELIKMVENVIRTKLITLDDIPYELANTVVNIYYRFFNLSSDIRQEGIPSSIRRESNLAKGLENYVNISAKAIADVETIEKQIWQLRTIDKYIQPNLYNFTLNYLLDIYKYDITNAELKPEIWRKIERFFRKTRIREIPNLIDLLDLKIPILPSLSEDLGHERPRK